MSSDLTNALTEQRPPIAPWRDDLCVVRFPLALVAPSVGRMVPGSARALAGCALETNALTEQRPPIAPWRDDLRAQLRGGLMTINYTASSPSARFIVVPRVHSALTKGRDI